MLVPVKPGKFQTDPLPQPASAQRDNAFQINQTGSTLGFRPWAGS
jgi:hypothetical protein